MLFHAVEHGLLHYTTMGEIMRGWARATQGDVERGAAEMREGLAEIYGWFTEGFGTADLQDATALLTELESRPR